MKVIFSSVLHVRYRGTGYIEKKIQSAYRSTKNNYRKLDMTSVHKTLTSKYNIQ